MSFISNAKQAFSDSRLAAHPTVKARPKAAAQLMSDPGLNPSQILSILSACPVESSEDTDSDKDMRRAELKAAADHVNKLRGAL